MSVSWKQLSSHLQKSFGYINAEIVQIKPSLADHFKHDAITTANVENGGQTLKQAKDSHPGRVTLSFRTRPQENLG